MERFIFENSFVCVYCENAEMFPDGEFAFCVSCNRKFDLKHAERTARELQQRGYISMGNDPLATEWERYFKQRSIFLNLYVIRNGICQYIITDIHGRKVIRDLLRQQYDDLEKKMAEVSRAVADLNNCEFGGGFVIE